MLAAVFYHVSEPIANHDIQTVLKPVGKVCLNLKKASRKKGSPEATYSVFNVLSAKSFGFVVGESRYISLRCGAEIELSKLMLLNSSVSRIKDERRS